MAIRQLRHEVEARFALLSSAEVYGDYGAGPNHTLPTAGAAASSSGLSVLTFLTCRTWLCIEPDAAGDLCRETARLARLEGLEAHARAAERRAGLVRSAPAALPPPPSGSRSTRRD